MLEMADAYATLANGGTHVAADDHQQGRVPERQGRQPRQPAAQPSVQRRRGVRGHAGPEDRDPGRDRHRAPTTAARPPARPAPRRTTTTPGSWATTPKLSTAVWVGYPQGNIPMADGFGGTLAAPIWKQFMEAASSGLLRRLPAADRPVRRDGVHRPAFVGEGAAAAQDHGRTDRTERVGNPTLYAQPTGARPRPRPAARRCRAAA